MVRLGITGGIAAGKSTAGRILNALGVAVIDTDDLARQVVEPGSAGLRGIVEVFGTGVLDPQGALDRRAMAAIVFSSAPRLLQLESILHPAIHSLWTDRLEALADGGCRIAAVVVPLLFEKGYEGTFDAVVAVACSEATQRARLGERGWGETETRGRLAAQWSMDRKLAAARYGVWTEGSEAVHRAQWELILGSATCSRA